MGSAKFHLNRNIIIETENKQETVKTAIARFGRDLEMTLSDTENKGGVLRLCYAELPPEQYQIKIKRKELIIIYSSDELGFIYGLLDISERYLGIKPFWFWNDQEFRITEEIVLEEVDYHSEPAKVRYRGWFINDEVLISHWTAGRSEDYAWEMALEALLRLGGNMVIPGTDKNARQYRKLASRMGLWITQHHAEPLGAEMFSRAYPELEPSYAVHPELFGQLWKDGIQEQKQMKVVWNLGFRGQGDYPFWYTDPQYSTPQARGELISSLITKQYELVCSIIDQPVCCTNLYGEIMELYQGGYLSIPDQIIRVWADNGYGKMVSRRQDNNNPRIFALPSFEEERKQNGLYYHVSFYDLQAANHITMFPNPLTLAEQELTEAFRRGADDFMLVNCSNIKPHVFSLEAMSLIWKKGCLEKNAFTHDYILSYYRSQPFIEETDKGPELRKKIADCFLEYPNCTIAFGNHEDEHAGEQFTNYTTRILASDWMKKAAASDRLRWATGDISLEQQFTWYLEKCLTGYTGFHGLYLKCTKLRTRLSGHTKQLFEDSIYLQVKLQLFCIQGAISFCRAYEAYQRKLLQKAFYLIGQAAEYYSEADRAMQSAERGHWKDFYANECLTDVKFTAYVLRQLMFFVRNLGDGPHFYEWQRDIMLKPEDKGVILITNLDNHATDEELYQAMKMIYGII
jgi:hypothetical protein